MYRSTLISYLAQYPQLGEETAYVYRHGLRTIRWTYKMVAAAAHGFARELERRQLGRGDRVVLQGENCPEWVAAFWGCLLRGCIVVPLDEGTTVDFTLRVQDQVGAKLRVVGGRAPLDIRSKLEVFPLEELESLIGAGSVVPSTSAEVQVEDTDIAQIIFTSGTTAEPKGVVLTHRNILANLGPLEDEIRKYQKWERAVHPIRFLSLVPLSHVFGQFMGLFIPQLLGGEVHFHSSLNPSEIIRHIRRQRVSILVLVPRILESLREWVERDYSTHGGAAAKDLLHRLATAEKSNFEFKGGWILRELKRWWAFRHVHRLFGFKFWAFICGGATLGEPTEKFWRGMGFAVLQGYGMTETAALISVNHPFRMGHGSIGKLMPGYELRRDESGEIMVKGSSISPGYWKGGRFEPRGEEWLRTGDIAETDENGNLLLTLRGELNRVHFV